MERSLLTELRLRFRTASDDAHEDGKDGDLQCREIVYLQSKQEETDVEDCGLQLWPCSLLMCDWAISQPKPSLVGSVVVELGCGVGLCGVVFAKLGSTYIGTDLNQNALTTCLQNFRRNHVLPAAQEEHDNEDDNPLDLHQMGSARALHLDLFGYARDGVAALSAWTVHNLALFDRASLVIACDLVYEENLTRAFVSCVKSMFTRRRIQGRPLRVVMCMEERFNFTLQHCSVVDVAAIALQSEINAADLVLKAINAHEIEECFDVQRPPQARIYEILDSIASV